MSANPIQGSSLKGSVVKPGDVVAGKYKIVRIIGEGGMGIIVEALHQKLDQRVAIKFHRPQASGSDESVARFLREAKASAQIRSEHVVRVTDVAMLDDGTPYFVMEYLEGRDLDAVIQGDGPLTVSAALDYTLQVCEALAEAHSLGIIHRDLKPANLFLSHRVDGTVVIKLLDFGISKTLPKGTEAELNMTKTRALMGSPLYMAPEQMRSTRSVDHRADIWSLGVLMHEMLTGETPFEGETLPEVCSSIAADDPIPLSTKRHDAPSQLEDAILRCLEKDPEHRFADVAELAMALATIAPPEASRSVERIVRLQRGQGTTPPPPATSIHPRRLHASIRPGDVPFDPNGDTLCIEPSDQRRSGVAPKLRVRAVSPSRRQPSADTTAGHATLTQQSSTTSKATAFVAGGVAFMVATAIFALVFRLYGGSSTQAPPRTVVAASLPAAPPPILPPTSMASPDPVPPEAFELVEVPATAAAAPSASSRPTYISVGEKPLPKGDHSTPGARPASSASVGAKPTPAPSGTAAFGASRD